MKLYNYIYDGLGRMKSAVSQGAANAMSETVDADLDANGMDDYIINDSGDIWATFYPLAHEYRQYNSSSTYEPVYSFEELMRTNGIK